VLFKGREAEEAWNEWRSSVDIEIEHLDWGSFRLLPLLYRNLSDQGVEDPVLKKYKGVYLQTWYKNQMQFHKIISLLKSFHDAGIDTIVLKGGALLPLYYKDYGLRPMGDFDILVRMDQAFQASSLLENMGWRPNDFTPTEQYIRLSKSHPYKDSAGHEVDLHWHVLTQSRGTDADDDFWKGAVMTKINDVATRVLNPTDQLLHVLVHGIQWDSVPTIRWLADSAFILKGARSEIDWDRFISQARKHGLILPVRDTLNCLQTFLNDPLIFKNLKIIQDMPITFRERIEYKITVCSPTPWTASLELWFQHARLMGNAGLAHKLVQFPRFLQLNFGLKSRWKVPIFGLSKIISWFRKRKALDSK
jgi:hypothetical protein